MRPSFQTHARELARAFTVRLIESDQLKPEEAFAVVGARIVICAPVIEETTYAVALHEIGHLAAPTGVLHGVSAAARLDEEEAAWAWARYYALEWTPVMERVACWGLASYGVIRPAPALPAPVTPPAPVAPIPHIKWDEWK